MKVRQRTNDYKTLFFYFLVGVAAACGLLLLNYGTLRLNSSLGTLYVHLSRTHFVLYIFFTLATAVLFGLNSSLFIFQLRRYGAKNIFAQSGGGIGAVLGIFASSCPVCGSTLLSLIGIVGGLSSLPLQGLEIKALSFALVAASVVYSLWSLSRKCTLDTCPVELNDSIKPKEKTLWLPLVFIPVLCMVVGFNMFKTDSINSPVALQASQSCRADGKELNFF